ncbi:Ig-like domain-containing protein [Anaerovorax odorimutans]|uniref:Ig-like domain-containing protein n=1 Tax=Anaerovorax odorimutans TaxID=109327 RepID=A0ABT1RS63_9FIRM|nr:Ig-like domain-containing protein [Anaerovorax odorimutans]MCQ4638005.1 Ig-like domain-containing protein [Anaerovorax odorimutans]
MKRIAKIIALSMVLFVGCAFTVPAATGTLESHAASKVKISKKKATVVKGKTLQLKVKGTKKKAKWTSSKKKVATVNKKGKVTAKKAGKTVITAKIGKKKYKCKITVKNPTVKISKTKVTANTGTSIKLTATTNGKSKKIKWKSSNGQIASVTSKGVVYANRAGTATITASANGASARCKVTVVTPVDPVGSRTNPANLANGATIKLPDGTAYVKLDKILKGNAAISQLDDMEQWDEFARDEYSNYPNTKVVYFEYTVQASSGFSNRPFEGFDIINPYGLYNSTCTANISAIEFLNMQGAYEGQDYSKLTLYGGASSKMYMVLFVPENLNAFSYPIYKSDYSQFWTKYAF